MLPYVYLASVCVCASAFGVKNYVNKLAKNIKQHKISWNRLVLEFVFQSGHARNGGSQ